MVSVSYSEGRPFDELIGSRLTPAFKLFLETESDYLKSMVSKEMKVLEVGCGSGRLLKELAPLVSELVGIDHSYIQVEEANRILRKHRDSRVVYADAKDIPYDDNYFHMSFSAENTFGNMQYDKFRILKEMRRVSKRNGNIILSVYGENAVSYQIEQYNAWGLKPAKVIGDFIIVKFPDRTVGLSERFSLKKLRSLFRDSGFSNFKIERIGEFGYMCNLKNLK